MRKKIDESGIREAIAEGYKVSEVAELFDVSKTTVYKILSRVKQESDVSCTKDCEEENIELETEYINNKGDDSAMNERDDELLPFQQQLKNILCSVANEEQGDKQETSVPDIENNEDTDTNDVNTYPKYRNEYYVRDMSCDRDEYKRGDIVHIRSYGDSVTPGVQDCDRYGVIFQNNEGNAKSGTVIVSMITSVIKKEYLPTHVIINSRFLPKESMIMTEQVKTVSKNYIQRVGRLTTEEYYLFDRALAASFALATKKEVAEKKGAGIIDMLDRMSDSKFAVKLQGDDFSFAIKGKQMTIEHNDMSMELGLDKCDTLISDLEEVLRMIKGR